MPDIDLRDRITRLETVAQSLEKSAEKSTKIAESNNIAIEVIKNTEVFTSKQLQEILLLIQESKEDSIKLREKFVELDKVDVQLETRISLIEKNPMIKAFESAQRTILMILFSALFALAVGLIGGASADKLFKAISVVPTGKTIEYPFSLIIK